MTQGICSVYGCEKPTREYRTMCSMHHSRLLRYGDVTTRRKPGNGEVAAEFERLAAIETDACVIWPHGLDIRGYGQLRWQGRVRKTHQLALELRDPDRRGRHACHAPGIGCNPACMNYRHLRWGTNAENMADRLVDGTDARGEKCWIAKLTEAQVIEIRSRYADGGVTCGELAAEFEVRPRTIDSVIARRTWAWL